MPNFNQPSIGKIVMPHLLFVEPRRRVCRIINANEPVVIGTIHVIDPCIGSRYLMKRVVRTWRQLGIISIHFSNSKYASWRPAVSFLLVHPRFGLSGQTTRGFRGP